MTTPELPDVLRDIRACRLCVDAPSHLPGLPHSPRPVLQLGEHSRILLAGQAPGARVHVSGRPFTDSSGERLRAWLGVDETTFYDEQKLAIVPMGFCFPGYAVKANGATRSDLPPRRECRSTWHDQLFASRAPFDLTLVIGLYARDYHLPASKRETLTLTIARQRHGPLGNVIVLPHPSWRNTAWLKRNPWFEADIIPLLRVRIAVLLSEK